MVLQSKSTLQDIHVRSLVCQKGVERAARVIRIEETQPQSNHRQSNTRKYYLSSSFQLNFILFFFFIAVFGFNTIEYNNSHRQMTD